MCGIPMLPPADAMTETAACKTTFEACAAHVGGAGGLISADGWELIERNTKHYLWKYPDGRCYCTACGQEVGDLRARHGSEVACPKCRQAAEFRHERRGHSKIFDEFVLYEWRKSVLDPETLVCTAAQVWRDSRVERPETSPRWVKCTAIYLFRPGRAAVIYKNHAWYREDGGATCYWSQQKDLRPEHTGGGSRRETVVDTRAFAQALAGTGIGRTVACLGMRWDWDLPEEVMLVVANCARRPWIEYLAKAGQVRLARYMATSRNVARDIVINPTARTPRALLGLTEAQWFEVRRDGIELHGETLAKLGLLRRIGLEGVKIREVLEIRADYWQLEPLAPVRRGQYDGDDLWRVTRDVKMPDKLRRRMWRRLIREVDHRREWLDYYCALRTLGEDLADPMLLLPRDMMAAHDRKCELARALESKRAAAAMAARVRAFRQERLPELRRDYVFRAAGLELRPYETPEEIVEEGKKLQICIGGYVSNYLDGKTIICCLRRAEEPDVPWRAVEFSAKDGQLCQDRGYRNDRDGCEPGERRQLAAFWAAYRRHKAKEKRRHTA